jgi:hypothetical protein
MAIEQYYFLSASATDTPVTVDIDRDCEAMGFLKHDGTTGTLHFKINGNEYIQLKTGESIGDKRMKINTITYKAGTGETVAFRFLAFVSQR